MSVFLGNSRYLMFNWIYFMNFLELCCQCKVWSGVFLDYWYQVGTWTFHVHPCRLRSLHPWWWNRDFRENIVWTWGGHVDLLMKTCRALPKIISMILGCTEGRGLVIYGRTFWGTMADFFWWFLFCRVCSLLQIIYHIGKYIGELLNCGHLGVADVGKWRLGCWVPQGMG